MTRWLSSFKPETYVFLILVLFGLILLFLNTTYKEITTRWLSGTVFLPYYTALDILPKYRRLALENEQLQQQVIRLSVENEQARSALAENQRLKQLLDFKAEHSYHFISARILRQFYNGRSLSLVLDKGRTAGIAINQAVVTPAGLIGRIISAEPSTAIVQTLYDPNCRVGARLQHSRAIGIALWESGPFLRLKNIPIDTDIQPQELAITSGMGGIFPAGFPVGRVVNVQREHTGLFFEVQLAPAADFSRLDHVFVTRVDSLNSP
ncbi:MAG: rod shape-determining protein MreC [Gemmatimonadetes bacterium]|nr:MAG: rod shape-determining protein MreC [Gemmatimonadota bacterium]